MAENKNTKFDRPGGYAMPKGGTRIMRDSAAAMIESQITLFGDKLSAHESKKICKLKPAHTAKDPDTRVYVGDCRDVLANIPDKGEVDLIFADPPFNWDVPYAEWDDGMPRAEYERFTFDWLDACIEALS